MTGNNIANVNTTGYTRQRLEQSSFGASGADRYYSSFDSRVGNGVLCTGLTQLRDPYLDIRYRGEMANVGSMDAKLGGLENIQAVLDEVGKGDDAFGIIEAQLSDMVAKLRQLSDQTGHSLYDIQVRASADTLTKQLNAYASRLQEVYKNNMASYQQDVSKINGILTNIRDLNATIRKNEIHGDNSLELRDEIEKVAAARGRVQDILLEVNIGREAAKSGFAPEKVLPAAEAALERTHVRVRGLMTIPPADAQRDANFRYFQEVQALYVDMNQKLFHNELEYLSMGMSGDYEDAIRAGATMVRVGSAIFGARHYN